MPLDHRGIHIITQDDVDETMAYLQEIGRPSPRWYARGFLKDVLRAHGIRSQTPVKDPHDGCHHAKYRLDCAGFDVLQKRAGGRCERCGVDAGDTPHGRLYIDHDHVTGRVRGLLCPRCNSRLRVVDRSGEPDELTAAYLSKSANAGRPV